MVPKHQTLHRHDIAATNRNGDSHTHPGEPYPYRATTPPPSAKPSSQHHPTPIALSPTASTFIRNDRILIPPTVQHIYGIDAIHQALWLFGMTSEACQMADMILDALKSRAITVEEVEGIWENAIISNEALRFVQPMGDNLAIWVRLHDGEGARRRCSPGYATGASAAESADGCATSDGSTFARGVCAAVFADARGGLGNWKLDRIRAWIVEQREGILAAGTAHYLNDAQNRIITFLELI
ncbi:uncharacterized protein BDZ99DRAFT_574644 [Mytilinidion resinicola]|uniref:Uncharacterized protein n=1 Tax=Mytilinidion resinicola TaxID=574789 RepID=A0A6A6YAI2_9PEZI|nr:uncharacterized protein BDZ99DRAFT_574644 [Mytilinidion resinicola]KAF2805014.1 hypothetical protein BDZ99DRAFT_574644 [Mytilinidion resinicola]